MREKSPSSSLPIALSCLLVFLSSCGFSDGFSNNADAGASNSQQTEGSSQSTSTETGQQSGNDLSSDSTPDNAAENTTVLPISSGDGHSENNQASNQTNPQFSLAANGVLGFDDLSEASGLAASRGLQNRLWVIADSGNSSELFAINDDGSEIGRISLAVSNRDWEELAAFTLNDQHYLLVADTGDNLRQYSSYPLHIVAEPQSGASGPLQPLVTLMLSYPDGAHDVEALAVAESDGNLYLVTKDETPGVYAVPLLSMLSALAGNATTIPQQSQALDITATRIGNLAAPAQTATDSFLGMLAGINLGNVTAMDIDDARGRIWLLTYRGIYLVEASANQTLGQALTSPSSLVARHSLGQAESLAYSSLQDAVFITSEGRASAVLKLVAQ